MSYSVSLFPCSGLKFMFLGLGWMLAGCLLLEPILSRLCVGIPRFDSGWLHSSNVAIYVAVLRGLNEVHSLPMK